jgi:hypothetical protein
MNDQATTTSPGGEVTPLGRFFRDSVPPGTRPIAEAISELRRENQVRGRCFARWISEGRLDGTDAKDRLERMQAAEAYLRLLEGALEKVADAVPF